MLRRLSEYQKGPSQIGHDYFVESFDIASGDWKQGHNSRRVHDHIDRAKDVERLLEESLDVRGLRRIRLHGDGFSAGAFNFGYDCFSFSRVAGIMHCNSEAVARQSFRQYTSDSTRRAGDDRAFC